MEHRNGKVEADDALHIESISLPIWTVNPKFLIKLTVTPALKNGEHAQKSIIGLKDLMWLGFAFDLQEKQLKWDVIVAPLVPKGFWSQHCVSDF